MRRHILYITGVDISQANGPVRHITGVIEVFAKHHDVTLLCPIFRRKATPILNGVRICCFPFPGTLGTLLVMPIWLLGLMLRYRFNLVYIRTIPFDVIAPIVSRLTYHRLFMEINGFVVDELKLLHAHPLKIWALRFTESIVFRLATKLLVPDQTYAVELGSCYNLSQDRFLIVPHGVSPSSYKPVENLQSLIKKYGLNSDRHYLLFMGFLESVQGVDFLLRAFSKIARIYPFLDLLVAGSGREEQQLRQLADELDITFRVFFLGTIPFAEISDLLHLSTICVAPYHINAVKRNAVETSIKIKEYLLYGKPVVACCNSGNNLLMREKIGLTVSPEDVEGFATAIKRLMDDKKLYEEYSRQAKKIIREKYTWEETLKTLQELL